MGPKTFVLGLKPIVLNPRPIVLSQMSCKNTKSNVLRPTLKSP